MGLKPSTNIEFTAAHGVSVLEAQVADCVCVRTLRCELMSLARFVFQACLIDRSSISPFRINNLQHRLKDDRGDCDTSPTCGDHLRAFPV